MKIGIITKVDNNNYGNRLQNYACQEVLRKNNLEVETLKNIAQLNNDQDTKLKNMLKRIKHILIKPLLKLSDKRYMKFKEFNKNIKFSKKIYDYRHQPKEKEYDAIFVGSDQVWNPNFDMPDLYFATFCSKKKRNSFSASFGIDKISENKKEYFRKRLKNFSNISVREDSGKKIVEELTGRNDVEVLVDPTMLLTAEEWDKVSRKPKQLGGLKKEKYILNYFLGELSKERKTEIDRIAKENNCDVINILDKDSLFYCTGPSEFLYLEKHAFLICTDSFHSCVFAVLYNRPFIIFNREDKSENMNSRIETLINKFNLKNRKYNGKEITKDNLNYDYTEAYKILEKERKKSIRFLRQALDLEGENND